MLHFKNKLFFKNSGAWTFQNPQRHEASIDSNINFQLFFILYHFLLNLDQILAAADFSRGWILSLWSLEDYWGCLKHEYSSPWIIVCFFNFVFCFPRFSNSGKEISRKNNLIQQYYRNYAPQFLSIYLGYVILDHLSFPFSLCFF